MRQSVNTEVKQCRKPTTLDDYNKCISIRQNILSQLIGGKVFYFYAFSDYLIKIPVQATLSQYICS